MTIEKRNMTVLSNGTEHIGILEPPRVATFEDVQEAEENFRDAIVRTEEFLKPIATSFVPSAESGLVQIDYATVSGAGFVEVGKIIVFGTNGQKIGVVVGVDQFYFTVRLLQT